MSRVALIGENSIEYIRVLLDIWNGGDCAVLIDYQIPPQIAVEMMVEAKVKKCYIEAKYYQGIYELSIESIELITYERADMSAQLLPKDVYDEFQENYSCEEAVVIYSSGTTGKSKGVILSHFAINTNADAIIDYMMPYTNDCIYIVRNLTHSSTITGELLVAIKTKTSVLIAPVIVPPRCVLNNIVKYRVTIIGVNPLLLSMYADEYRRRTYDISTLKKMYVSGSILGDEIYDTAHKVFEHQEIYNVYGLSEAGPRVAAQRYDCCKGNSVGKSIKGVEIAIVDEYGSILTNGEHGIVHINSPSVFCGYITGETKHKSLYKGWLNTGDIGYIDEYGELHIVSRVDDLIIIGSHKIYPHEIEQRIRAVFAVKDCAVVLVELREERIIGCLYVSELVINDIIKHELSAFLVKYEIPKLFVQTDTIPKTRTGKVSVHEVKKILLKKWDERQKNEYRGD